MSSKSTELSLGWKWKERNPKVENVLEELSKGQDWNQAALLPTEIHVELMRKGVIPHPYDGFNEHAVQCKFFDRLVRLINQRIRSKGSVIVNGSLLVNCRR